VVDPVDESASDAAADDQGGPGAAG
jgi:hypothetical protein